MTTTTINSFDPKSISDEFLHIAKEAERYRLEVTTKIERNSGYKAVHDEYLAKFYVYNNLCLTTSLESKTVLLKTLRNLKSDGLREPPTSAFDVKHFEDCRQRFLTELLQRFEHIPDNSNG